MEELNYFLEQAVGIVWGPWLVILLCGMGVLFTILLGFPQLRAFRHAIDVVRGKFDKDTDPGELTHFQALCTALSGTVGLGNISGVAVAIAVGGPGATFWMILVGFLGMTTKFVECTLAIMYRKVDASGEVHGGPMHYIVQGMGQKWKPLAAFYAVAITLGGLGAGNMFQTNQVASILSTNFHIPTWITGFVLALATAVVIIGGIKRIGQVTSRLVPLMAVIYVLGSFVTVLMHWQLIPELFAMIFTDAFTGTAAVGGFSGAALRTVIIQGVRRACFSNEAGLGSAAVAHSAAATKEPVREGVVALMGPFIDTIVICTMTALVILISGAWQTGETGVVLTAQAFNSSIPGFGNYFIPVAVLLFGYSTLISWSYYGERAIDFLFCSNKNVLMAYKVVFCILAFLGAIWSLMPVINFSDMMVGLMVVPNAIAMFYLFPRLRKESQSYFSRLKKGEFN